MKNEFFCLLLLLCSLFLACQPEEQTKEKKASVESRPGPQSDTTMLLLIGTYTRKEGHVDGKAKGIYLYEMNLRSGALNYLSTSPPVLNPSYLAVHPSGKYVYAVQEHGREGEHPTGTLSAFVIDREQKALLFLNSLSAEGDAPCFISVEPEGRYVMVANYMGGNVAMLPIAEDGRLLKTTANVQHQGTGPHSRQEAPHAHMVLPDPENRLVYACDLGIDQVRIYEPDYEEGSLKPTDKQLKTMTGAGPRHLAFHPHRPWIYVLNELNGSIEAFHRGDHSSASFQRISTRSKGESRAAHCAAIRIHPSGKYLYASNRGELNNIAMYAIDQASGNLSLIGHQSTFGKGPRDFVISPSGDFLLVANQDSDTILTFRIDLTTGRLIEMGISTTVLTPVCLQFL